MESVISVSGVTKRFDEIVAVKDIGFTVNRGEILGFLGPNGSGKTTTVRLLNGVLFPDEGKITVQGLDTVKDGDAIRKLTGIMTETAMLYENMSAKENLEFFAQLYGVPSSKIKGKVEGLLEQFGLKQRSKDKVFGFSTGMKKRLAVAKALVHDPEILFLDEPTSGLDPESARDLISHIRKLNENNLTVFVCTHNLSEAEHFCTRFAFLDKGGIFEMGTLAELETKYERSIQIEIHFTGNAEAAVPKGVHYEILGGTNSFQRMKLTIPTREAVPQILRKLSGDLEVYAAMPVTSGLESLYFEIRRALHEQGSN